MGQIGTGRKIKVELPVLIELSNSREEENMRKISKDEENKIKVGQQGIEYTIEQMHELNEINYKVEIEENLKTQDFKNKIKVAMVAGGYGHTAAITGF